MSSIISLIVGAVLAVGAVVGLYHPPQQGVGVDLPGGEALFETALQDRISSTDTSMTLVSNELSDGTSLSGYHCFTIDEGRSDQEYVCGTVSGTTVSSLERGISPSTATSTVASLKFAHRVGANIKVTDFPLIQRLRNQAYGVETYPNLLSYTSGTSCTAGSSGQSLCPKTYVDSIAVQGAATSTESNGGLVELGTISEQASSYDGGANKPTVLQTKNSTSTCQVVGSYNIVASSTTGKLDKNCIDQSLNYSFTGINTFATSTLASTTVQNLLTIPRVNATTTNATSTFAGGIQTNSGVTFPDGTTQYGASNTKTLYSDGASYTTTQSATTTMATVTIPAGTLQANDLLRITVLSSVSGNSGHPDIQIGTGSASTTVGYGTIGGSGSMEINIANLNSVSSQRFFFKSFADTPLSSSGSFYNGGTASVNTGNQFYIAIRGKTIGGSTLTISGIFIERIRQ